MLLRVYTLKLFPDWRGQPVVSSTVTRDQVENKNSYNKEDLKGKKADPKSTVSMRQG